MIYRIFHPVPILAHVVEHYWYSKIDLSESVVQHYATPLLQGLAFNFNLKTEEHEFANHKYTLDKSAYIFGQPTCPRVITTNEKGIDILGVKFKPLGITKITGINMENMADKIIAVDAIWGNELELLSDEMQSAPNLESTISVLESFLINKYLHTKLHYRVDSVQNALALIAHAQVNIDVKTLQEKTNITRKTLERAFRNYLGIHPKLYSRIIRFNSIKNVLDRTSMDCNLTALAMDFGFYDCSHFISEFKNFSGLTPHTYLKNNSTEFTREFV